MASRLPVAGAVRLVAFPGEGPGDGLSPDDLPGGDADPVRSTVTPSAPTLHRR
jgi:hypothetical protein